RAQPILNEEGPQRRLDAADGVVVLERSGDGKVDTVLSLINPFADRALPLGGTDGPLSRRLVAAEEITPQTGTHGAADELPPLGMRVFSGRAATATGGARSNPGQRAESHQSTRSRVIVIQNITPEVDCGRYPAKREVGGALEVRADIFREGH